MIIILETKKRKERMVLMFIVAFPAFEQFGGGFFSFVCLELQIKFKKFKKKPCEMSQEQ